MGKFIVHHPLWYSAFLVDMRRNELTGRDTKNSYKNLPNADRTIISALDMSRAFDVRTITSSWKTFFNLQPLPTAIDYWPTKVATLCRFPGNRILIQEKKLSVSQGRCFIVLQRMQKNISCSIGETEENVLRETAVHRARDGKTEGLHIL